MSQIYNGSFVLGSTSATTLSAGEGIKLDTSVPGVIGISNDETVLYSGAGTFAITANESIYNFEYIDIYQNGGVEYCNMRVPTTFIAQNNNSLAISKTFLVFNSELYTFGATYDITNNGTVLNSTGKGYGYVINAATTAAVTKYKNNDYNGKIVKLVGINRISGGN